MTDDAPHPQQPEPLPIPAPFDEAEAALAREALARCDDALQKFVDEIDYRNVTWYVARASLRWVTGAGPDAVSDDLYLGARCLHGRESMHLDRIPLEKFVTRRLLPVELALVSGQPAITTDIAGEAGLSVPLLLANASEQLHTEAARLTSFFRRGSCATHQDLAGLGAISFAGALSAIARGFDDEAALCLNVFADAREPFARVVPPAAIAPVLRRYDALCLCLATLLRVEPDRLATVVAGITDAYAHDLKAKIDAGAPRPADGHRYLDLSSLAVLAIAALRGMEVPLAVQGPVEGYARLYRWFMTAPRREVQPTLDAKSKEMLRSMGLDPASIGDRDPGDAEGE